MDGSGFRVHGSRFKVQGSELTTRNQERRTAARRARSLPGKSLKPVKPLKPVESLKPVKPVEPVGREPVRPLKPVESLKPVSRETKPGTTEILPFDCAQGRLSVPSFDGIPPEGGTQDDKFWQAARSGRTARTRHFAAQCKLRASLQRRTVQRGAERASQRRGYTGDGGRTRHYKGKGLARAVGARINSWSIESASVHPRLDHRRRPWGVSQ